MCVYIHMQSTFPFPAPFTSVEARARLLLLVEMSAESPASGDSQSSVQLTFDQKVSILLGDLSQPLLGLKEDTFHSLSKSVDIIIHNGAWVNHVLPYTGKLQTSCGVHCDVRSATHMHKVYCCRGIQVQVENECKLLCIICFVPAALRDCNVGSTKEVLRFALVGKKKFLHFISTIGVICSQPGCAQDLDEHMDISALR